MASSTLEGPLVAKVIPIRTPKGPGKHPFAEAVRKWIARTGAGTETRVTDEEIVWRFQVAPGISVIFALYIDSEGETFFFLESAIAKLPTVSVEKVTAHLLDTIADIPFPYRVAIRGDQILVQARGCECSGYQLFELLVNNLVGFSLSILDGLGRFGVVPLLGKLYVEK